MSPHSRSETVRVLKTLVLELRHWSEENLLGKRHGANAKVFSAQYPIQVIHEAGRLLVGLKHALIGNLDLPFEWVRGNGEKICTYILRPPHKLCCWFMLCKLRHCRGETDISAQLCRHVVEPLQWETWAAANLAILIPLKDAAGFSGNRL